MSEIEKKIVQIVNDIMEIDISKYDPKTQFSAISSWDSFNNLMLISRLQDEFKLQFTALEIENTKKIEDLLLLIANKITKLSG